MLSRALEAAQRQQAEVLVGMDSNAHSTRWGSPTTDARGHMVESLLISFGLQIANQGSEFTYYCTTGKSHIDLTLGIHGVISAIQNWKVVMQESFSDHRLITYELTKIQTPYKDPKWVLKKADWGKFREVIAAKAGLWQCPDIWTPYVLEDQVKVLNSDIKEALTESCPRSRGRPKKAKPDWWTDKVAWLRKAVKAAKRSLCKFKGTVAFTMAMETYREARREFKNESRRAKHIAWKLFLSKTTEVGNFA